MRGVVVDGGGVGKSDELAVIGLCALSYKAAGMGYHDIGCTSKQAIVV